MQSERNKDKVRDRDSDVTLNAVKQVKAVWFVAAATDVAMDPMNRRHFSILYCLLACLLAFSVWIVSFTLKRTLWAYLCNLCLRDLLCGDEIHVLKSFCCYCLCDCDLCCPLQKLVPTMSTTTMINSNMNFTHFITLTLQFLCLFCFSFLFFPFSFLGCRMTAALTCAGSALAPDF